MTKRQNRNQEFLVEFATGEPVGLFRVGGRSFEARALTVREGVAFQDITAAKDTDLLEPFAGVLTARAADDEGDVTTDWLAERISGAELYALLVFLSNPTAKPAKSDAGGDLPN